jgi:hypothetical protein
MREDVGLNEILMKLLQEKIDFVEAVLEEDCYEFTLNIFMKEIKKDGKVIFRNKNIIEEGDDEEAEEVKS